MYIRWPYGQHYGHTAIRPILRPYGKTAIRPAAVGRNIGCMANGRPFGFYDPATSPNLGACGRLKIKNKKPETPSLFFCGKKKMKNEGSFFAV
jgi:hypothetical protein